MATEIIYEHDPASYVRFPAWYVVRQPEEVTDPMVVNFRKQGEKSTRLNQNARWTPLGWDPTRWRPDTSPHVPRWLLVKVVLHMQTLDFQP
jgi:hypothetical protein